MKTLKKVINESINEELKQKFKKIKTEKTLVASIYKLTSHYTSHKFRDDDWSNLRNFIDVIGETADDIDVTVDNGGYGDYDDKGRPMTKTYYIDYMLQNNYGKTFEISFQLKAYAAGSMQDPFDAYDMTLVQIQKARP